jgi:hypothetical protein
MSKKSARRPVRRRTRQSPRKPAVPPAHRVAAQSAKPPVPPPAATWFGISIDGKRVPYTLPSVEDAATVAKGLREQGHKVAIYDQQTNRIVKRL